MRVGLLTSWQTACGVYSYSRHLADALARRPDVELTVLAPRNDPARHVADPETHRVVECFQIGHWRDDGVYALDTEAVLGLGLDVLHAQYQSILLEQGTLGELARRFPGTSAVTFHDSCNRPDFPVHAFDLAYTHRHGVGWGHVLPFGIDDRPPLIRTFGLGRARVDLIGQVCDSLGYRFEPATSHEGPAGGQRWVPQHDLHDWLRQADAIVLYYDDVAAAGSSQAARTALATRRPVFVNATTWFKDLSPDQHLCKVASVDHLQTALKRQLDNPRIRECSWDRVAERLVGDYRRVLSNRQTSSDGGTSPSHSAAARSAS